MPRCKELAACLFRQFLPLIITKEEFSLMRSSFLLTHHIRTSHEFSFMTYLRAAMEEEFSHVVGLGLPMWCFIILFVLLSSAIGKPCCGRPLARFCRCLQDISLHLFCRFSRPRRNIGFLGQSKKLQGLHQHVISQLCAAIARRSLPQYEQALAQHEVPSLPKI